MTVSLMFLVYRH